MQINAHETEYSNTEQELNRAIREHKEDGERFWFSKVSMTIQPVMISESPFDDKNETDVEIRTVTLTKEVSTDLKQFNNKRQMTNFEFFIGIYQLFLHLVSENDVISVASFIDLRQFLERSKSRLTSKLSFSLKQTILTTLPSNINVFGVCKSSFKSQSPTFLMHVSRKLVLSSALGMYLR
jgi:hypothetical protein